jgi:ubiquinone/menaquinone biosynthesis C-methylase UbiE
VSYDAVKVAAYFDAFAEREWQRLETSVQGRSSYAVHKRFLDERVREGMRVLDIGSGPGRFAIDMIERGARVTVADLSPVQVDLARRKIADRGLLDRVAEFRVLDVTNLSGLERDSFDAVVCYGGVLSYTRERHVDALHEIARVLRPGGVLLASVMSLYGTMRLIGPLDAAAVLESNDQHFDWQALLNGEQIIYTRLDSREFHHPIGMFTSVALRQAVEAAGLHVETMASSNSILPQYSRVPNIEASERAGAELTRLELAVCDHPGLVDAGGHLIVVATR